MLLRLNPPVYTLRHFMRSLGGVQEWVAFLVLTFSLYWLSALALSALFLNILHKSRLQLFSVVL